MKQTYTSANTSINSTKLPAVYNKIDFIRAYDDAHCIIADYGCGKFNNARDFIEGMGLSWMGYDKFNRSEEENLEFINSVQFFIPDIMICSNVLNVIDSEDEVQEVADYVRLNSLFYFVTVYEGDKSGDGRVTKNDCYQRNEKLSSYLRFFPGAVIHKGVITNAPEYLK